MEFSKRSLTWLTGFRKLGVLGAGGWLGDPITGGADRRPLQ
jgi:hypothetical protein